MTSRHLSDPATEWQERLTDEFFERLERDGKHPWTPGARDRLQEVLERYVRLALNLPEDCQPRGRATEKVRKKAELVRESLEALPDRDNLSSPFCVSYRVVAVRFTPDLKRLLAALKALEEHGHEATKQNKDIRSLQIRLKHLQRALEGHPDGDLAGLAFRVAFEGNEDHAGTDGERLLNGLYALEKLGRIGLPRRPALKLLIFEVARIYRAIGGKVTLSPVGPFAGVLCLLHEVIPETRSFAKTPAALVRFAEERRSEIKDRVRRYPLVLGG
jgi:hypothetical protein